MTRWLVAGAGRAGRCHISAIERVADAHLAGVVSHSGQKPNDAPTFRTLTTALASVEADALIIATPNDKHLALATEALSHGLPVLCEKPIGRNAHEAAQLLHWSKTCGAPVGAVLNQRFTALHRWVHQLISQNGLKVHSLEFKGALGPLTGWFTDPIRSGGGMLRTIGIHYLDLMVWWLGQPLQTQATMSGDPLDLSFELTAAYPNDVVARLHFETVERTRAKPVSCTMDGAGFKLVIVGGEVGETDGLPPPPQREPQHLDLPFGPGHQTLIAEATEALSKGAPFPVTLEDALPSIELVDRLYAMAR